LGRPILDDETGHSAELTDIAAQETGRRYGEIRATLGRQGQLIGNNDVWIAAHALAASRARTAKALSRSALFSAPKHSSP
jgi:hypothetical protein